jgi:HipA-like protein
MTVFQETVEALKRVLFRFRPEGHEGLVTPKDEVATFVLHYGELEVGTLLLDAGLWEFRYSAAFKSQESVQPLIDFPDPDKVYRAEELWPFFLSRIPSTSQPRIRETIEKEGLDAHNEVELLRYFGRRTISNPFTLEAA